MSTEIRNAIGRNIDLFQSHSLSGPLIIGISLVNVEGYTLTLGFNAHSFRKLIADRNDMVLPEVWIESVDLIQDPDEVIKPLLDIVWQSFGMQRCMDYDENGIWSPNRT